jgi:C4-dicarboxylate transporter DctM subunit
MVYVLTVLVLLLFLLNVPVFISVGLPTVVVSFFSGENLLTLAQTMFSSLNSFTLMAVPFFILAGKLMEHGGISERLVDFANSFVGHVRGGLAYVMVIACMFFAAISGSALGTIVAIGGVMLPAMIKAGYDRNFSAALLACAGMVGVIIPPSVPMVVYATTANASVGKLFMAGVLPGILIGLSFIIWAYYVCRKHGYGAISQRKSIKEIWASFKSAIWALLMPVIILGGIYGGIFTPTEAAVVAVVYGFIVGIFVYKLITLKVLKKILLSTVITTSVLCLIIATATYFGMWLTREQIPQAIAQSFQEANLSPLMAMMLINLFLLLLGTFMESAAAQIITTPILLPIVTSMGFDPVHFGVIMIANLALGAITPPLGVNLVLAAQIGKTSFEALIRPSIPLMLIIIIDIVLIILFPQISIGFANWLLN